MTKLAFLVFLVACEKSGPIESTPGTSSTPTAAPNIEPPKVLDAGVATLANDAARVAIADAAPARPRRSNDSAVALDEAEARRIVDILTATSPADGDLAARKPYTGDLGKQIQDVRDGGAQVSIGGGRGTRGDGDPRIGTGRGPSGSIASGGGKTEDTGPVGRISIASKQAFDDTTLTVDMVLAKIQSAYMSGVKRCYKTYLKKDASARGKLALNLSVNETGRTVDGKASGFASEIDACLTGLMLGWRFPIPKDKDGEATSASFSIGLQLVPD